MKEDRYGPCLCGSGKKFKFCCGSRDSAEPVETLCRRASELRIEECLVVPDWETQGIAHVVVARQTPDLKYLAGVYLVDVFCLGVKNTFVNRFNETAFQALLARLPLPPEKIAYEDARSLILGGVEYARQWGFEPHPDWSLSGPIVEPERSFRRKYTFGQDGKPFYIEGPDDDVKGILKKLDPLMRAKKADYLRVIDNADLDEDAASPEEERFDRLCSRVSQHLESRRFREAEGDIDSLFREYPDRWESPFYRGTLLAMQGSEQAAISFLERAARLHPSAEIYYNLAGAHQRLFEMEKFLECLDKTIELDERGEIGRRARADRNEIAAGVLKSSGLTLDRFRQNNEKFNRAYHSLMVGRLEEAAAGFKTVLAIQPNHVQSHGNLGLVYGAMGDRENALLHLNRAIALDPKYEPAILNRRAVLALAPGAKLALDTAGETDYYQEKVRAERERMK